MTEVSPPDNQSDFQTAWRPFLEWWRAFWPVPIVMTLITIACVWLWAAPVGTEPIGPLVVGGSLFFLLLFFAFRALGVRMLPTPAIKATQNKEAKQDPRLQLDIATATTKDDVLLQLLKLEYESAVDRYENIYKAIWQNFSYMSVVAGGILTFGSKQLSQPVLFFLALAPLVFWLLATFLPLDYYGQDTRRRLAHIESQINSRFFRVGGLRHFQDFNAVKYRWHVREVVKAFGFALVWGWCLASAFAIRHVAMVATNPPREAVDSTTVTIHHFSSTSAQGDSVTRLRDLLIQLDRKLSDTTNIPPRIQGAKQDSSKHSTRSDRSDTTNIPPRIQGAKRNSIKHSTRSDSSD